MERTSKLLPMPMSAPMPRGELLLPPPLRGALLPADEAIVADAAAACFDGAEVAAALRGEVRVGATAAAGAAGAFATFAAGGGFGLAGSGGFGLAGSPCVGTASSSSSQTSITSLLSSSGCGSTAVAGGCLRLLPVTAFAAAGGGGGTAAVGAGPRERVLRPPPFSTAALLSFCC